MTADRSAGAEPRATSSEWGGACDPCRITWVWPRERRQTRGADLKAGRCPRCAAGLRPAHGQPAYQTVRASRWQMGVDQCQVKTACNLPNYHSLKSGWPCRSREGRL